MAGIVRDDCPHGDDPYMCAPCHRSSRPEGVRVQQSTESRNQVLALFAGQCRCGAAIDVGDPIVGYGPQGNRTWMHAYHEEE